jgi:EAL domain-containing protein (putative c-di-GMP-specific phosphodiesterase class I)
MNMQHHDDRVIVESTVQLAHALNLQVIAEGVETEAAAAFLKACGYDYGQGYLYSVALEPDALLRWIRRYDTSMLGEYRSNSARQLSLH